MTRLIAAAALGVACASVLISGCSSDDATVTEQTFEPRPGTQSYASAQEIVDDLTAGGFPCETPFEIDATSTMAANAGRCNVGGVETVMSVYTSTGDRDEAVDLGPSLFGAAGIEYGYLVGANWTVNCGSPDACVQLKAPMGGKIVAADGS
ncbi:hypothetical protein [Rhodococcus sp. B10]|uniref:hypothetical protein n=1 Tax=Rhodococcus sp. B10 TaxID=2695876 RepID=UPI0014321382|nr:hypothetical protein [Rhodococcus sp. B10]NIL77995.1 hypothetical protein [Rhodococcus sp. B10]